jgi:non-canonical poly(A) RNA polymerase PAPD5/7
MHSIRTRPICRAHDTFSPAIALWQHFVAPNQRLAGRLPKSSFATEAAQGRNDDSVRPSQEGSDAEVDSTPLRKIEGILTRETNRVPHPPELRRFRPDSPQADAQISKRYKEVQKLLIEAYDAFDSSQDYKGVVVSPISTCAEVPDDRLPWHIPVYKNLTVEEK